MEHKTFRTYVKAVMQALTQYQCNTTDASLVHLQRQLDALSSVTNKKADLENFLDPKQELANAECISGLVSLLTTGQANPLLAEKIMSLLSNLANSGSLRKTLTEVYYLLSSLAHYRQTLAGTSDPNLLQCLRLMAKVSYGCKIPYQESYVEDLLSFLSKAIQDGGGDLFEPSLNVLCNMCRKNFAVQNVLKNMSNNKGLCKVLLGSLTHGSHCVKIWSLSILHSVFLEHDIGAKVFGNQNVNQTFMLMFSILFNNRRAIPSVVNLFTDMLRNQALQKALLRYADLHACVRRVVLMISSQKEFAHYSEISELLLLFFTMEDLKPAIIVNLLSKEAVQQVMTYEQVLSMTHHPYPLFTLIFHAAQPFDVHSDAPKKAFDLVSEVFEEALHSQTIPGWPRLDLILPFLLGLLQQETPDVPLIKSKHFQRQAGALQLLLAFVKEESFKDNVTRAVENAKVCSRLIDHQLENNPLCGEFSYKSDYEEWCEYGLAVALHTLNLVKFLSRSSSNMHALLYKYLQETCVANLMAHGITSQKRETTIVTMSLLATASSMSEFPIHFLGDTVASINTNRCHELNHRNVPTSCAQLNWSENKENQPKTDRTVNTSSSSVFGSSKPHNIAKLNQTPNLDRSVQELIDKMQSSLDMRDMKSSDVITVYQHRLQSLQMKDSRLQDLLEAKSLALAQADRFLAELRHRTVQYEAEATKLRELLRESEKSEEMEKENFTQATIELEKLQTEHDSLLNQKNSLESIAKEYQELLEAHTDQSARLEGLQKTLSTLRNEHEQLVDMHEVLKRHHDQASDRVKALESESEKLVKQVKEKDNNLKEYKQKFKVSEDELKKVKQEQEELDSCLDKFKAELENAKTQKKNLLSQLQTLELACKHNEQSLKTKEDTLKEKEKTIAKQAQQIEKLTQIQNLITQIAKD